MDVEGTTEVLDGIECDAKNGYHVMLMDADSCKCGERKRIVYGTQEAPAPSGPVLNQTITEPNLRGCARCGGDHVIRFKKLTRPMVVDGGRRWSASTTFTHWGVCPSSGEPILMRFVTEPPP